ncbi:MAG TPA: hypothetical protein VJT31_35755 [Rugosimonospora sp.]|nr:hypothetical protein [Rugosimonospora sp.]
MNNLATASHYLAATHTSGHGSATAGVVGIVAGAVALMVALLLMWERPNTLRTQAVLMVIAGAGIAGLGHKVLAQVSATVSAFLGSWTTSVLGASVPWILALGLLLLFVLHMDPKRGRPRKWTPWVGLLVPVAWVMIPWATLVAQTTGARA